MPNREKYSMINEVIRIRGEDESRRFLFLHSPSLSPSGFSVIYFLPLLALITHRYIKMQTKSIILAAALATAAMATGINPRQPQEENTASSTTTTSPESDNGQPGPSPSIFTESEAVVSDGVPETASSTATAGTTLSATTSGRACGPLVSSFNSAFPAPTGAYSSYLNSVVSKGDVCAMVRSVPATVSSAAAAYETALGNYLSRPENLESLVNVGSCLAATPSLVLAGANSAEVSFLAKATDLSKCKSAASGVSMKGAAFFAGVAAVACAFGMA